MALTEQQRAEIYSSLADTIGQPGAEFLMANHPPGGWEQLATKQDLKEFATKQDLKALEDAIKQEFATKQDLEVGLSTVRVEMREGFAAVQVVLAGMVAQSGKTSERRASVFYANFLTLLVLCVAIVSVVVSLN